MSVRRIWAIASVVIRRSLRDPGLVVLILVVPIVAALVFGLADQRANDSLIVGVVRASQPVARDLIGQLKAEPEIRVQQYGDLQALDRAVRRGDVQLGVTLPANYDETVGTHAASPLVFRGDASQATFIAARVAVLLVADRENQVVAHARVAAGKTALDDRALSRSRAELLTDPARVEKLTAHGLTQVSGFGRSVAGMLVFFVFGLAMGYSMMLISDRKNGIIARSAMTRATDGEIIAGEIGGRFLLSLAQGFVIVVVSALAFHVRWGDPLGVTAVIVLFAIVSACVAVVVGCTFGGSHEQAIWLTDGLMALLGVLGGCFFALALLPAWVRAVGHLAPHAWAVDAFNRLLGTDGGVGAIAPYLLILSGFAFVSFAAAVHRLRKLRS